MAAIVGDHKSAKWLGGRADIVQRAFLDNYVDAETGRIADISPHGSAIAAQLSAPSMAPETQTGYVMPLAFDLLPADVARKAGEHLADLVMKAGRRLQTGFCGSAYLPSVLERAGYAGLAYDLLLRREPPSLGFMVEMGSTSVWERWDGLNSAGWPACPTMNSFNHYAMSSMLAWLIEGVCGLRPRAGVPGLNEIRFAPALSRRVKEAAFTFEAPSGRLQLNWAWQGDDHVVGQLHMPAGMTGSIAGTVAVDDNAAGAMAASGDQGDDGPGRDRLVRGGDHEVVWQVTK